MKELSGTLVLSAVRRHNGELKRLDVLRAGENPDEALAGLPEGEYDALVGGRLERYRVEHVQVNHRVER